MAIQVKEGSLPVGLRERVPVELVIPPTIGEGDVQPLVVAGIVVALPSTPTNAIGTQSLSVEVAAADAATVAAADDVRVVLSEPVLSEPVAVRADRRDQRRLTEHAVALIAVIGDCTTTTALAMASAWPLDREVVVLEADRRGGSLASWLDTPATPSLTTIVAGSGGSRSADWPERTDLARATWVADVAGAVQDSRSGVRFLAAPHPLA